MIVAAVVATIIRRAISEMYGSVKTMLIETFDERYPAVNEATIVAATATVAAVRL